ncbi:hypothetical protein [Clostridium sporogenes]|uniref:hypothetical protein n=1 Tax=Clostridium sporogenes TaxID=1509 RepID=UPI001FA88097|nr:hypothetical protein [Clostridium sporogenes]
MVNNVIAVNNDGRVLANVKDPNYIKIFGELTDIISVEDKNTSQARNIARMN